MMKSLDSACLTMTISTLESTALEMGFKALSDPLRLRVLNLLRQQELCVCDLCDRLDVRQSKLSFHLKTLKAAQLIRARQEGKWVYYSLNLPQMAVLEQYLSEFRRLSPMLPSRLCNEEETCC